MIAAGHLRIPPSMADPVRTLLLEVEEQCGRIPGCELIKAPGGELRLRKLRAGFSAAVSPGYAAFASRYDGGHLGRAVPEGESKAGADEGGPASDADDSVYLHLLAFEESQGILREAGQSQEWKGLWPVARRGARIFALDFEASSEGEQPVVELGDRCVDRVGSSFLRFLSACLGEIAWGEDADPLLLAKELCRRDPVDIHEGDHGVLLRPLLDHLHLVPLPLGEVVGVERHLTPS